MVSSFNEIPKNEQKSTLRDYFKKYKNIKYRIIALEKRKRVIEQNSLCLKSPVLDRENVMGCENSTGAAAMTYRCSEIEVEIKKAKSEAERAVDEIFKTVKLISPDLIERLIIEYRYIDCMNWNEISETMNYSRSRCHDYENAALNLLLTFARVQKIVLTNYNAELTEKKRILASEKDFSEI